MQRTNHCLYMILSDEGLPDPQERLSIMERAAAVQQSARLLMRRLDQAERQGLPVLPGHGGGSPKSGFVLPQGKTGARATEWPRTDWTGAVKA